MKKKTETSIKRVATWLTVACSLGFGAAGAASAAKAAEASKTGESAKPAAPAQEGRLSDPTSSVFDSITDQELLTDQDREVLSWGKAFAAECSQVMEKWLDSKAVTEERLFARLYYPVPDTDPVKYTTEYDALSDNDIAPVQEKYLSKAAYLSYVVMNDVNGYVPTHNQKHRQPLTGNRAVDLVNNRTKRMFMTMVGYRSSRSQTPFLVTVNERDNGERALNLSVPIYVRGKHWGAVRIGYRPIVK
jgi:methyl-accepting chemotaxis protein